MRHVSAFNRLRLILQGRPTKSYRNKKYKPREVRRLFLVFCTALLLESVILQLITTADGSEVAFNPDPITHNNEIHSDVAVGSVAGVTAEQIQPEQPNSAPRSLVTHVNAAAPTAPLASPSLLFHYPLAQYSITQYFSAYHLALDMAAPTGTPVFATTEGVVANTGYLLPGGGLMVKVDHDGGYSSYYAHLSAITSTVGQKVNNSTQIARVGATGWATGPHLHFMIWKNQQAVNPLNLLQ